MALLPSFPVLKVVEHDVFGLHLYLNGSWCRWGGVSTLQQQCFTRGVQSLLDIERVLMGFKLVLVLQPICDSRDQVMSSHSKHQAKQSNLKQF